MELIFPTLTTKQVARMRGRRSDRGAAYRRKWGGSDEWRDCQRGRTAERGTGWFLAGAMHSLRLRPKPRKQRTETGATTMSKRKVNFMTFTKLMLALTCIVSGPLLAQEAKVKPQAKVTELLSKDITNLPGKEGLMITVNYPPGSSDPIHRHNAHAFVYVLEGSIVMQVRGGKETVLTPGQTFYEGPEDVHVVGRNASQTKPAKFVVFLMKDKGAPVVVPAK